MIIFCKKIIKERNIRYEYINTKNSFAHRNEQFYETLEGTARYIEKHIDFYSKNDPILNKYINPDLLGYFKKYGIRTYYYMLHNIEIGESYYYETGFGLSLLLDKLNPTWKEKAFKTTLWHQVLSACKS